MPCINPIPIINPTRDLEIRDYKNFKKRILVPCGKCVFCRKRYASDWRVRLSNELRYKNYKNCYFVTLTFSDEFLLQYKDDPCLALKRFHSRYRKLTGKSLRHWYVTELGGKYGRLHIHGVIFDFLPHLKPNTHRLQYSNVRHRLAQLWKYGFVFVGDYCNVQSVSYIVKYIFKPQTQKDDGYDYRPQVFTSPSMGEDYVKDQINIDFHRQHGGILYIENNGFKSPLPRFYKLKLFTIYEIMDINKRLEDDPPPLLFCGRLYSNIDDYENALESYYNDSKNRHSSNLCYKPKRRKTLVEMEEYNLRPDVIRRRRRQAVEQHKLYLKNKSYINSLNSKN